MDRDEQLEMYREINDEITPEVVELFKSKQRDYTTGFYMMLGPKAQFVDINRKFWKLYGSVWEGNELHHEGAEEIAMDMIGHLLLMIHGLRHDG